MKKISLLISAVLILLVFDNAIGQHNKFSIDINLPKTSGDSFIEDDYDGITSLGLKYNVLNISKLDIGFSANIGVLNKPDVNVFMFKPRVSTEIKVWKINPYLGVGYAFFNFSEDPTGTGIGEVDKSKNGVNLNVGLKFHLISKLYINFGIDYTKFRAEDEIDNEYYRNVKIFDLGIGIQL